MALSLALLLCARAGPAASSAGIEPPGSEAPLSWQPATAAMELLCTPARILGDLTGAIGLLSATAIAMVGDTVAVVDRNRISRGFLSGGVHRIAQGFSFVGTQSLERLRAEEVERWPEAPSTYLSAAPFVGRLDTGLSGVSALRMAASDLGYGFARGLARMAGANQVAERMATSQRRAASVHLGPRPLGRNRAQP